MVVSLLLKCLSVLLISALFLRRRGRSKTPCPQSYPIIGNLIGFLQNRHRFHDWVTELLSTSPSHTIQVNGFLGLSHGICTADPTNLHHLLRSNFPNYIKGRRYSAVLHEILGTGIFSCDGHLWSSQRKIASHEFTTKSLSIFIFETLRSQTSKSLIPHLLSAADAGETFDLQQVLRKFTFDNICNVAFGVDTGLLNSKTSDSLLFVQAFDAAVEHASHRLLSPLPAVWKMKRFFNIGNEKKYKDSIEIINHFAMDIIKKKETRQNDENFRTDEDLLSRFMASSSKMNFNDEERRNFLRDIIISFILAGKDSTSSALTWFFWLLAAHPHSKHLIHKEFSPLKPIKAHLLNITFNDLKNLHYLHAALSESMRLFPPVAINSRLTVADDILPDGTFVGKGWFADYSAYAMGRMERLWGSDYGEFKPERWLDGNGVYRPVDQYKYPVFHGGFRLCLGKEMAYLQMKYLVVAIMCEFDVEVVGGGGTPERMVDPPYNLSVLLSMKNGLPVRLKKKHRS